MLDETRSAKNICARVGFAGYAEMKLMMGARIMLDSRGKYFSVREAQVSIEV